MIADFVAAAFVVAIITYLCRRVKGMLKTLDAREVGAEKREFMRLIQREKRRSTYLKAAKASAGSPQDVVKAKAAAERRLKSVASLQNSQQHSSPHMTVAGDSANVGFFAAAAAPSAHK